MSTRKFVRSRERFIHIAVSFTPQYDAEGKFTGYKRVSHGSYKKPKDNKEE